MSRPAVVTVERRENVAVTTLSNPPVNKDMAVKQDLFRRMDAAVHPSAILATDTLTVLALSKGVGKSPSFPVCATASSSTASARSIAGECEFMLEEACLPHEIDSAMRAFGFAMRLFASADLQMVQMRLGRPGARTR